MEKTKKQKKNRGVTRCPALARRLTPPPVKIACRNQATQSVLMGALDVTFPSPSCAAMWGLADSLGMPSSVRSVS